MRAEPAPVAEAGLAAAITAACQPIDDIESVELADLLERIGGARLVLLGEASHGTSEFYRMRQRITRELIEQAGFDFVAIEADWPDARLIDSYVRGGSDSVQGGFRRFPQWMWRNTDVLDFVEWLRAHNDRTPDAAVAFHGLDLYSLHDSTDRVLGYLDEIDPSLAADARRRYGCLTPYMSDPAAYGAAAMSGRYRECEQDVLAVLRELCERRGSYLTGRGEDFLDAEQNALVARDAEGFYRAMYYGTEESWNLRDRHMFDTLQALLAFHGPAAKGVVWAHNSHLGDARATEMAARGQLNLGQLIRERYGPASYHLGFGTDRGTVMAASNWGEDPQVIQVRPADRRSYEGLMHETGVDACLLPLRAGDADRHVREALCGKRLERAIGVIYSPRTELASHYFRATLPAQFDEYCWFDRSTAVTPVINLG